jgi:divalent metal cation (Fe/Co/Zn/Cd) transporter
VTDWYLLDGIVACAAGISIVRTGTGLVREAVGRLMDESDASLLEEICDILNDHRKELWIDVHRLRAWRSGSRVHADFHLILPRDLPLEQGHREVKELEAIFSDHFGGMVEILIHLDPCTIPECPVCSNEPCDLRNEKKTHHPVWQRERLTCETESALVSAESAGTTSRPTKR